MNNNWKIFLLAFISFLLGTLQFVFGGILDKVAASVGVSVSAAGQLITAFALGSAIGTPITMMVTAKMERRKLLLLALAVIILSTISTVTLPGFSFLIVSRVVLGIGFGVYGVCAFSIVEKLAPAGRKARALSNLAMGSSAALVLGIPLARMVTTTYGWKAIFWGIGILSLLSFFAVMRAIPATESEAPVPLGRQLALLKKPKIDIALGVTFFMFTSYSVVNTYITPFLTSVMPMIEHEISAILFGLGVASLIGAKLGGLLADHIGAELTLIGGMVVQALALVLISIFPTSVIVTVPLLMLWAIAAWTSGLTLNLNLVKLAPEASGIMLSLNGSFIQFGFAAGAGIGGIAVGGSSIIAISWIGAVSVAFSACAAAVSFGLPVLSQVHDNEVLEDKPYKAIKME
ncbi:MFS transporter, DHA1 family, purine base/nucleoside efflux pump [Caldanaerobius fijiensis DSM 17918]|uniref:MFS transporter, DHA1 family, purine base/nucleoside efflux pump n=1 Tax=Caldanaerobius fijiensis DSM 17918 TaxID=1121256 RepID=A0A1M5DVR9_9THEO|nr:MFS transporter [Caldanaerobius fijiensis]SHF70931.1 MFS transporter, DHA1 family, purine base/nucleoside efflux pump [Caldanaerobius fijiensis DSM 17918]